MSRRSLRLAASGWICHGHELRDKLAAKKKQLEDLLDRFLGGYLFKNHSPT
jgi:hypothetical protein